MVRTPCSDKSGLKKGTWTPEEDRKLIDYVTRYGTWNWRLLPRFAGLARCGKSCRLRWLNYLRPNIKRGNYTEEEEDIIIRLHEKLGNKWSVIATHLPGRTDNEIKNHWHTTLKKRFVKDAVANSENVEATKSSDSGAMSKLESESPTSDDEHNYREAPVEIVADIGNDNFEGSDSTVTGAQDSWEWELSTPSSSAEYLVPKNDHFDLLEPTLPTTANFWAQPYVADMSHVPNELLVPLVTESDEYLYPMYDVDLWSQNNSQDLHACLFQ